LDELKGLFDFRSKDTLVSLEDFVKTESRKVLQGKFMDRDYFIRFVKEWNEISEKYGDVCYRNCGYVKIEATVVDDTEAIFTPCTYKIEDVKVVEGPKLQPIMEIASFRGRFCEQAKKGEIVIAQGKIEHVKDQKRGCEYFRLLLGNKPTDYMILKP
jgi:predicted nucleotidyltransferase